MKTMKKTEMVGLGRVVMHRRERLLMLEPRSKGIQATALRYKPEVRNEDDPYEAAMTNLNRAALALATGDRDAAEAQEDVAGNLRRVDGVGLPREAPVPVA